uniref:superoxide dismutase n=1 Tax=Trichocoleus desertorum TaxID=1481672 RepID=UPI0028F3F186|nr:superoxide dismutase [Trichocoleus desertorum]
MQKFLQKIRFIALGLVFLALAIACQPAVRVEPSQVGDTAIAPTASAPTSNPSPAATSLQLPPLPYDYAALEPHIDAETMRLHHDNHHATYVKNLNEALQKYPNLQSQGVEALLQNLNSVPEEIRTKVRNNGGGHLNHTMFWQIMSPDGGGEPTGALAAEITKTFGSFENLKQQFNAAGGDRFGSGWVWLVRNPQGQLQITTTPNQDTPLMEGTYPIMGNDVWEHAYYLKYRNRRAEYLNNWWNVVNWAEVNQRFTQAGAMQNSPRS